MGQLRMAGAFPESDDDDDTDTDEDDLYDSPGKDGEDAEEVDLLGEALVLALRRESKTTTPPNVEQQQPGTAEGESQKHHGAEWGVD